MPKQNSEQLAQQSKSLILLSALKRKPIAMVIHNYVIKVIEILAI